MHAGRCRTFNEVLGLYSLSGSQSQKPHSDAIGSRQESVRGMVWEETIAEASPCFRILGFHPRSERETQEAELQRHSRHICGVHHIY
jgi:hypothetical protein